MHFNFAAEESAQRDAHLRRVFEAADINAWKANPRQRIAALNAGHAYVSVEDVRAVALPALRHRILLNFEGAADDVSTDTVVQELLEQVATE